MHVQGLLWRMGIVGAKGRIEEEGCIFCDLKCCSCPNCDLCQKKRRRPILCQYSSVEDHSLLVFFFLFVASLML